MMHAAGVVILGAATLAIAGAVFGLLAARLIWSEDLVRARHIDAIRSKTEQHLRGSIESLERTIALLRQGQPVDDVRLLRDADQFRQEQPK